MPPPPKLRNADGDAPAWSQAGAIGALTSGRLLARNTLLNLLGQGAPLLVALIAIPLLIDGLGTDRFGVLSIAWVTIGYFGLFDLGLGRAMTQSLAAQLAQEDQKAVGPIAWTGLFLMVALGCLGAVVLFLLTPRLVGEILQIPEDLQRDSANAFYLLALSLPIVISTTALRGILEANQRFELVNLVRLPMGVFSFAGPVAVLPFSNSLTSVVAVLVAGRVAAWVAHFYLCLRALPILRKVVLGNRSVMGPLIRVGGWLTVTNLVSPLMVYADRFLIGAALSMTAVTYYATPYDLVTKLWIITAALLGVLFPAFAASYRVDPRHTARLYDQGLRITYLIFFPLTLGLVTLAGPGLDLWLGVSFAENSTRVLQWLAVGVFINSLGQVAYTAIQGIGRADLTGKLHLLELPLYVGILYWMLGSYGIVGAAIAWTVRVAIDTILLVAMSARLLPGGGAIASRITVLGVPAVVVLLGAMSVESLPFQMLVLAGGLVAFGGIGWWAVVDPAERARIAAFAGRSPKAVTSFETAGETAGTSEIAPTSRTEDPMPRAGSAPR